MPVSRAADECQVAQVREVNGAPNIHSLSLPEEAPSLAAFAAVNKVFVLLLRSYWSRVPPTGHLQIEISGFLVAGKSMITIPADSGSGEGCQLPPGRPQR